MIERDVLQRFLFEKHNIRGELVRLHTSYQAITNRHPYPMPIQQLLGKTLAATALLSATLKFTGTLTLQVESKGPVNLLVAQSNQDRHLRGLARWDTERLSIAPEHLLGDGRLALTITPTQGERYQGITAISNQDLASSIEMYFQQSEQLPTRLCLFANAHYAAGILLQAMPDLNSIEREYFWEHVVHLMNTLQADELLELPNQVILKRLFHEEDIRLFEAEPVVFRCSCSIERMERAVHIMGPEEVQALLKTHKVVNVTCEFCNNHYDFDAVDIARIFAENVQTGGHTPH